MMSISDLNLFFPFKVKGKAELKTALLMRSIPNVIVHSKKKQTIFTASKHRTSYLVPHIKTLEPKLTPDEVRHYLRSLGLLEEVVIHTMDRREFLRERDLKALGRGGEGAVYFLRGHVVKLIEAPFARMALREIAHMLHLNPACHDKGESIGLRMRNDFPSLLWLYLLADGGLAIGMRTFDEDADEPGTTFEHRMRHGPPLKGSYVVRMLLELSRSLAHAHQAGIIHHDLKPANVYLPSNPHRKPVVFDFGQSLWRQASWGRVWADHPHNKPVWYNGTYRYMNAQRRRSHSAALSLCQDREPSEMQNLALAQYRPDVSDDVFAFARMLRDVGLSPYPSVSARDDEALRALARRTMGLKAHGSRPAEKAAGLDRVFGFFGKRLSPIVPAPGSTMNDVTAALEVVLGLFDRA